MNRELTRSEREGQAQRTLAILIGSIVVTVLLYYIVPYGRTIAYPLILLSTMAHELGHGVAAILVGASFERFVMHADGSGVAMWSGNVGRFARRRSRRRTCRTGLYRCCGLRSRKESCRFSTSAVCFRPASRRLGAPRRPQSLRHYIRRRGECPESPGGGKIVQDYLKWCSCLSPANWP